MYLHTHSLNMPNLIQNQNYSNKTFYKNMYFQGVSSGYPKCCVYSFIANHFNHTPFTHLQICVSSGTGFIPCIKHSIYLHSNNLQVHSIIRKH